MRSFSFLMLLFLALAAPAAAQNPAAEKLFLEGIALQEENQLRAALKKFNEVLRLEPAHISALSEKAYALMLLRDYKQVVSLTSQILNDHRGSDKLLFVYVNRGNALGYLGRRQEALAVFNEGLTQFPEAHLLHFNKGLTLSEMGRATEAQQSFERAALADPEEPGTHLALAHVALTNRQRIPAALAFARFLVLEPEGKRAKDSLKDLQKLLTTGLAQPGTDTTHNFSAVEQALDKAATPKNQPANNQKDKTAAAKQDFTQQFAALCAALNQQQGRHGGFFWQYYAPYFAEMHTLGFVPTFTEIVFIAQTGRKATEAWLQEHEHALGRFYAWSEIFPWQKKLAIE